MKNFTIKKALLILLVLVIIAIAFCGHMHHSPSFNKNGIVSPLTNNQNKEPYKKVVGTTKKQKYSKNDLEVISLNDEIDGIKHMGVRISGLKNKKIENLINSEIEAAEIKLKDMIIANNYDIDNSTISVDVMGNFSNVLSVIVSGYSYTNNKSYSEDVYLNYDLNTGKKIELADLFLPGVDIDMYAQNKIYKDVLYDYFADANIFYNPEYWDEETGTLNYFVNDLDEEGELRIINEYNLYKNSKKDFYFSSSSVTIKYGFDKYIFIDYINCLDDIVIFNKYVTKDSIFEKEIDVAAKDIYVCSDVDINGEDFYFYIEDVTPNLRIDVRCQSWASESVINSDKYKEIKKALLSEITSVKAELLEKANSNSDKYYYYTYAMETFDFTPDGYSWEDHYPAFNVWSRKVTYEVSKDDFENWFEERMADACRKPSMGEVTSYTYLRLTEEEAQKANMLEENLQETFDFSDEAKG